MSDYRTFVVPFDFSEHARAALFAATDLAKRLGADLHLVHVIQPPSYAYGYGAHMGEAPPAGLNMLEVQKGAEDALNEIATGIEAFPGKIQTHVVQGSSVAKEIRDASEKLGADLIVMGTHGRTGLAHAFLGSVAERTLRTAPCPVLTVPASKEARGGD